MKPMKWVWSQDKRVLFDLEKVRNFTFSPSAAGTNVVVWFSDKETLHIGKFETNDEAIIFLKGLIVA